MKDLIMFFSCIMAIVLELVIIGLVAMWRERDLK